MNIGSVVLRLVTPVALAALLFHPIGAKAQPAANYPDKPIHLVVGFAAGGGADILARLIGKELAEGLNATVLVENKPGAGSNISAQYVAQSKPDGYTILMGTNTLPVNQAVYKSLGYSLLNDLMPVSMIGNYPTYLIVGPNSPFNSVQELLAFGKANPSKLNSGGSSPAFQLVNQLLTLRTGVKVEYVGYKGTNETIAAVAGGELTMAFVDAPVGSEPIRTGKVKALAVTSLKRSASFPNVPTMEEAGVKDFEATFWSGIFAPAGTPDAIVKKLQGEIARFVKSPAFAARLNTMSADPVGNDSADFKAMIAREIQMWTETAKAGNISVN